MLDFATFLVQSGSGSGNEITLDPGDALDIGAINIPIFTSMEFINNFSPFSYVALLLNILFVGITLLWIFLMIKAAVDYMRSNNDEGVMQGANKQISSVFASISLLFFSFVFLIILGGVLGLGNFFDWPRVLSVCDDGSLYVTKALELEANNSGGEPLDAETIGGACFGGGGGLGTGLIGG